jgi:hypothetical protein
MTLAALRPPDSRFAAVCSGRFAARRRTPLGAPGGMKYVNVRRLFAYIERGAKGGGVGGAAADLLLGRAGCGRQPNHPPPPKLE